MTRCLTPAPLRAALALLAASTLAACAPMVTSDPAELLPPAAGAPAAELRLARSVDLRLATGYGRSLPAGSRWSRAGRLPQGEVYRPVDAVFSIEGRQVHEAWLVVAAGSLRGFYLPGEARFSPLSPAVQLPIGDL